MARLKIEDFRNLFFDRQRVVKRQITFNGRRRWVYEGTTYTDNFVLVGFTYFLSDSTLRIVNTDNQVLFFGKIASAEDFEKAIRKADKKHWEIVDKQAANKKQKTRS